MRQLATRDRDALVLLRSNLAPQDAPLLQSTLTWTDDPDEMHGISSTLLEIAEHDNAEAWAPALLDLWSATPFRMCRAELLERLIALELAPAWLLAEARHDANFALRELAGPLS